MYENLKNEIINTLEFIKDDYTKNKYHCESHICCLEDSISNFKKANKLYEIVYHYYASKGAINMIVTYLNNRSCNYGYIFSKFETKVLNAIKELEK